jgi:hypothetical protein
MGVCVREDVTMRRGIMASCVAIGTAGLVAGYAVWRHAPQRPSEASVPAISPPKPPGPTADGTDSYLRLVEADFDRDRGDPAWNPSRQLMAKVARLLTQGASVRALECRSSLCRLETSHPSAANYAKFTRDFVQIGGSPVWAGPVVFKVLSRSASGGGSTIAVAYLARDSLPRWQRASNFPWKTVDQNK